MSFAKYRLVIVSLAVLLFSSYIAVGQFGLALAAEEFPAGDAQDGSLLVYQLRYEVGGAECYDQDKPLNARLFFSVDGGKTWQERGQQFNGRTLAVGTAYNDARVVYAIVSDGPVTKDSKTALSLYFSSDSGLSWEKRSQVDTGPLSGNCAITSSLSVRGLPGIATPVTVAEISYLTRLGGSSGSDYRKLVTVDGGYKFYEIGYETSTYNRLDYAYTTEGLLRYKFGFSGDATLELSIDGGQTWQARSIPKYNPSYGCNSPICAVNMLEQPANAPGHLFLSSKIYATSNKEQFDNFVVWYSSDNGRTWQELAKGVGSLIFSFSSPLEVTALNREGERVTLNLPNADKVQLAPMPAKNAPGGSYFPETGHNLYGKFKEYWLKNGGLEQFGYPKTEPFREVNPTDGKTYVVQYFERNRFEYHPENAGTKYEVLLGLLGIQLTELQRKEGHGAFNRFADMKYPRGTYFAETGHNLRNTFKEYWEANGGLAIHGYPISEEFEEVNPDNGKTYVVQYFERSRFEWHPENKGTKYEVLLGLLGNSLLRAKGWL